MARRQSSYKNSSVMHSFLLGCPTVFIFVIIHLCSVVGFCPKEAVPYCTCSNKTLSVSCSGRDLTTLPDNYQQSIMILNIDGANLEILESVPYAQLQSLSIENSQVRYIKYGALNSLTRLSFLYLAKNEITSLTNMTFAGMRNLSVIKLSLNPLYVLKQSVFSHTQTPNLTEIRLEECLLYEVELRAFAQLNNLAYLNLSFNYLRHIPVFHKPDELDNLHTLDLSGNLIQTIAGSGLGFLTNLQSLHLHTNKLERITRQDMLGLHDSLRYLDISKNKIFSIEGTAFTEMKALSELYLDGNQITSLYWEDMPWGSLNKITLMNNPWDCSCNNSWMVEGNYPHIQMVNDNPNTKCASPKNVAKQPVFSVPIETFACEAPRQPSKTALTAVFAVVVSLIGIASIVVVILRIRKRRKRQYQQPYTKVTINGGIHM